MTRKVEAALAKGQRFCAYSREPLRQRVFIEVRRVARDHSWADLLMCNWAVAWTKRQPLHRGRLAFPVERFDWDRSDLAAQNQDWTRMNDREALAGDAAAIEAEAAARRRNRR